MLLLNWSLLYAPFEVKYVLNYYHQLQSWYFALEYRYFGDFKRVTVTNLGSIWNNSVGLTIVRNMLSQCIIN